MEMKKRPSPIAALGFALLLAALILVLSVPRVHAASTVTVEISGFAFQPSMVTIQVGDTVTWTNLDGAAHTATDTGPQALFDGVMDNGESFSYTFTQAGTFNYVCTFHPEMTGTVIVQASVPDAAMASPDGLAATALGAALLFLSLLFAGAAARPRRAART